MSSKKDKKSYEDIIFLFIGEGYKKSWCINYVEKHDLNNCQFHNYVDTTKLGLTHSLMHIGLVSLSPGQEGLSVPSKMYGLLSAEVPILAIMSENTETALVISENNCGKVVRPGGVNDLKNEILELYNKPNIRTLMGKNGRKLIDE